MFHRLLACLALSPFLFALASAQTPAAKPDAVRVLSAQAGMFGPPGTGTRHFTPSTTFPLRDGQAFGWMMTLQTTRSKVLVREELTAPAEPLTWGDPEPDLKRKTSPDGRTVTTEIWLEPKDGVIFHSWTVTQGDPKGTWVWRVWIDGQAERSFRLEGREVRAR